MKMKNKKHMSARNNMDRIAVYESGKGFDDGLAKEIICMFSYGKEGKEMRNLIIPMRNRFEKLMNKYGISKHAMDGSQARFQWTLYQTMFADAIRHSFSMMDIFCDGE